MALQGEDDAARLARKFALVDASFGFLARHRAVLSVKNVLRMANSLGGAASETVTREELHEMAARAPKLIRIEASTGREMQHKDDVFRAVPSTEEEREVVAFPLVPQASQRASERRKKLFSEALQAAGSLDRRPHGGDTSRAKDGSCASAPSPSTAPKAVPRYSDHQLPVIMNSSPCEPVPELPGGSLTSREPAISSLVIDMLRQLDIYRGQIVHVERLPARAAQFRGMNELDALDERVIQAVSAGGVQQLYSHQFEAIEAVLGGKNVVLSTSTSSGKSLAYNVPMGNMLLEDPAATFIYLFPTKALAQDQLKALRKFMGAANLPLQLCSTFDGDTEMKARTMIIRDTNVFLTNPDMLHLTILPQHARWKRVLANLKMIVVDEAHMYRGVFGSHVACVFRRLFRLCALHGSNPQVVCCSATIQNPDEHFRMLFPVLPPLDSETINRDPNNHGGDAGARAEVIVTENTSKSLTSPPNFHFFRARELMVITEDGAPRGEKLFCMWNPRASPTDGTKVETEAIRGPSQKVTPTNCSSTSRKRKRARVPASKSEQKPEASRQTDPKTTNVDAASAEIKDDEPVSRTNSAIFQSARIFARLMEAEVHTLLFCRGRKLSELVLMTVHSILRDGSGDPSSKAPLSSTARQREGILKRISTYRGGYTVDDRRAIERRLFSGDLLGVIATNALELGIDVGALDCTVHLGLPTSIASLWQQAGRAGRQRSSQSSTAVVVCFDAPLDQHFSRHAQELFRLPPEAVALNPNNEKILSQHLVCAARESPLYSPLSGLDYIDSFVFGSLDNGKSGNQTSEHPVSIRAVLKPLIDERKLMRWPERRGESYRVHACAPKTGTVSLRSINEISYTVVTDDDAHDVLDTVPGERVFFQVYPTAVYLHQAREYLITRIDSDEKVVYAKLCTKPLTYFTACRDFTDLTVVQIQSQRPLKMPEPVLVVAVGVVSVITRVFGSTLLEKKTLKVIHTNEFSLPPMQSFGRAVWLELPREVREQVEDAGGNWVAALHGVGHLCVAVMRLFVLCDSADIGTEHPNPFEARVKPSRVTLYEQREGGSGLVDEIIKVLPQIIDKTWAIASECTCADGCPACIQSASCSEFNHVLDKRGTLQVLEYLRNAFATGGFDVKRVDPAV